MTTQNSAGAHASRMRSCTNILLDRLSGPHIGRQGPLCATVTCEDLDTHFPSEYDGFEAISLCAQQTSISDQLMPVGGGTEASHPRQTPNFHEIAGLTTYEVECEGQAHPAQPQRRMHFPNMCHRRNTAGIVQDAGRVVAFPSQQPIFTVEEAGGSGLHSDIGNLGCLLAGCGICTPYQPLNAHPRVG